MWYNNLKVPGVALIPIGYLKVYLYILLIM
ncbi:hypothetical protein WI0192307A02_CDS0061 [Pseudomonas phage KG853]|uniref:Uncharacterized protein n=1 Tax=Pseudomonas phage Baskent_P1_112 TaxID=3145032 RepID=A0AAU8BAU6_9CAUD